MRVPFKYVHVKNKGEWICLFSPKQCRGWITSPGAYHIPATSPNTFSHTSLLQVRLQSETVASWTNLFNPCSLQHCSKTILDIIHKKLMIKSCRVNVTKENMYVCHHLTIPENCSHILTTLDFYKLNVIRYRQMDTKK